ncbi:MAG: hypothetical protein WD119_01140 [Pirellulaceae bacterium]
MSHHVIPTVLAVLALHSAAAGQEAQLASGSARILPVAQQAAPLQQAVQRRDQLAGESIYGNQRYAVREDGQLVLPDLTAPTTSLEKVGSGSVPAAMKEEGPAAIRPIPEGPDREGMWGLTTYNWHAPNTFSNPRYFEDAMLERHGHERFPVLQPAVSGFRFFSTVPMLPYLMTVRPPCDTEYTLGFYRPGSRAPGLLQRPPYERKAVLVEAAAVLPFAL